MTPCSCRKGAPAAGCPRHTVQAGDLGAASFKGPVPKPGTPGGIGRPKKPRKLTAQFVAEKAEKRARAKLTVCRICPNTAGWRIEPHHIVRRGAPHFGTWDPANIMGLCLECHTKNHDGDPTTKKAIRLELTRAEVEWSDSAAYQGYVDDIYWPLPKDAAGQTTVASELLEAIERTAAA